VQTTFCAHERVVRGEDLRDDGRIDSRVLEIPLALMEWEPAYPLATYTDEGGEFPAPPMPAPVPVDVPPPGAPIDDRPALDALRALVEPWTVESNGRLEVVAVEGGAAHAIAALGPAEARAVRLRPEEGLAWLAWAGASGGAHGRRRGMATGRFGAWWTLVTLAGLAEEWPVDPDEVGAAAHELHWYWWDAAEPVTGWQLRLAIEDPADGLSWAIAAQDVT